MINFTNKFETNSSHIGLFITEEFNIHSGETIPKFLTLKIKSFLKKYSKKTKRILFHLIFQRVKNVT